MGLRIGRVEFAGDRLKNVPVTTSSRHWTGEAPDPQSGAGLERCTVAIEPFAAPRLVTAPWRWPGDTINCDVAPAPVVCAPMVCVRHPPTGHNHWRRRQSGPTRTRAFAHDGAEPDRMIKEPYDRSQMRPRHDHVDRDQPPERLDGRMRESQRPDQCGDRPAK